MRLRQRHDLGPDDLDPRQGRGERYGLIKGHRRIAAVPVALDVGMKDPSAGRNLFGLVHESPFDSLESYRLIGCAGMIVEIACL